MLGAIPCDSLQYMYYIQFNNNCENLWSLILGQVFFIGRSFLSLSIFPKSQEKAHFEAGDASGLDWFFVRVQQWVDLSWRVGDAVQESLIFLSHCLY